MSVLKKDAYLDNEFYLDSYTVDNNGNYTFYFNYKTEDLKLKPTESLSSEIGMNSFIEITAVKGRVSKYKICCFLQKAILLLQHLQTI